MKSKIIYLICLALSAMMLFAACEDGAGAGVGGENNGSNSAGNGTTETCEHTFSDAWTTNETHHWHAATCEHGENRDSYAEHIDADEDSKCDSCEYDMPHVCTYADEWQYDASNHWRMTTCATHTKPSTLELHSDANSDAKCDSCGAHVHVLSTSGICLDCNEQVKVIDTSDMSSVIAALVDHQINVSGGKLTSNFIGRYNNSAHSTKKDSIIDYLYGEGSAYYKIANALEVKSADREGEYYEASTSDLVEKWAYLEDDDSITAAYKETVAGVSGELTMDVANANVLNGHYVNVSTLASGYGAEGVLKALYERSQELGSSDFTVEEGEGNYKFSFNYLAVNSTNISDGQGNSLGISNNVNYFVVNVEFSYNADYALTYLYITCDCYTSDAGSNLSGDFDLDNVDLEYAAQTGKINIVEGAKADTYTFTFEQTVGERTFVNEYNKAYFAPKGFIVYADEACTTLCPDTITVSLSGDKYARFYLEDADGMKFTSVTAEALEWTTSDESGLSCQFAIGNAFSFATSHVKFLAKAVGTYTVTLTYQGVTKTFTVNVVA